MYRVIIFSGPGVAPTYIPCENFSIAEAIQKAVQKEPFNLKVLIFSDVPQKTLNESL